jgi:hypothetical protein
VRALNSGFHRPTHHITRRATGPASTITSGDTIWILSQINSPWGSLPAGLDARIDVKRIEVCPCCGTRRFIAANSSTWFPLANMTGELQCIETFVAGSPPSRLLANLNKPLGQSLQSIRLLASAAPLKQWSKTITSKGSHFISYRICDGTKSAFEKAKELLLQGNVVFWDRWCLPRRLAERRELVDDHALNRYLMKHLRKSKIVWGIESAKYFTEGSYSAREYKKAQAIGKYQKA